MAPQDPSTNPTPEPVNPPTPETAPETTPSTESAPSTFGEPAVTETPAETTSSEPTPEPTPAFGATAEPTTPTTTTTTTEPVNTYTPVPPIVPAGAAPSYGPKSSKKKFIGLAIAAVLALLLIGGGIAFAVWYNSPDKVLGDALGNTLSGKAATGATVDFNVTSNGSTVKMAVTAWGDSKQNSQATAKLDISGSGSSVSLSFDAVAAANGDLYIRAHDLQKLIDQMFASAPGYASLFDGVVQKVDNKWVKITKADLDKLTNNQDSVDTKCINDATNALRTDNGQKKELSDLFQKNRFVTIKSQGADETINGRSSVHYVLDVNKDKSKAFGDGLKSTTFYKKIKACLGSSLSSSADSTDSSASDGTSTLEVWIDKGTRQFTKVSLSGSSDKDKGNGKFDVTLDYSGTKAVTIPTDATTIDELQQQLQEIYGSFAAPSSSDFSTDPSLLEQ